MTDPEYKSQRGMTTISSSSSIVGVMQNNRVFCDFDLSTKGGSIHDIQDILIQMDITNRSGTAIAYLTSTYLMYDLMQIMIDDNVVEEIRSDNAFADHALLNSDILGNYALLEGFGDIGLRITPHPQFIPHVTVDPSSTQTYFIVVPPTCISNKNIPLQFVNSGIKLRIYFKTKNLVLSNYKGSVQSYDPAEYSTDFIVSDLKCIIIGNKYDDFSLQVLANKYVNKSTIIPTNTHSWRTINIGKPDTNNIEVKVSLNGKMSDLSFFMRQSNTSGVQGAQYIYDVSIPATPFIYAPFSNFRIDTLTLKDSQGDYAGYYSNIKGQVLGLIHSKYQSISSVWNSIFAIYNFNFSNNLIDSIKTGIDYGYCALDGNFNLIFNPKTDLSMATYINSNIDLVIVGHQQKNLILDETGKLFMPKGQF